MKDEEMAEEWVRTEHNILKDCSSACVRTEHKKEIQAFLAGLKAGRPQWHKVFTEGEPYSFEYWDLPQDNLPKVENFYFVKLKNGHIKICELKYNHWTKTKKFYDLHGGTQSNVAEWLDYPTLFIKEHAK